MKYQSRELSGVLLNYAVAVAKKTSVVVLKNKVLHTFDGTEFNPIQNIEDSFNIILNESLSINQLERDGKLWEAKYWTRAFYATGENQLIAACRCFLLKYIGEEIDIPDHVLKEVSFKNN